MWSDEVPRGTFGAARFTGTKWVVTVSYRLDRYSSQAEALPTLLAIAPVAFFIAVVLPEGMSLKGIFLKASPFLTLAAFYFVASQIGADFGKRQERRLWAAWGGPPTTRFLRHNNPEYNKVTRRNVHEILAKLGFSVPTPQEETQGPQDADERYAACVAELRRLTRDKEKFPLVYKRLIDYGFRRNLLGLKWMGLVTAATVSILCVVHLLWYWDTSGLEAPMLAVGIVSAGISILWLTVVNERTVSLGADRYANALLEAARDLE